MLKSLVIKVPTVLAAIAIVAIGKGAAAWIGAIAVLCLGAGVLAWPVFDVNSSFWAKTLWRAEGSPGAVALTFDDGPHPRYTPRVLAILEAKRVPATFFVIGENARAHPDLLASIDQAGHLVANHSDHHGWGFHFAPRARLRRELMACNAAIANAIGKEPTLFRSPQGFKTPALGDALHDLGFLAIGWQVRGLDAMGRDSAKIAQRIASRVKAGAVVQMHDGAAQLAIKSREATLGALPDVIDRIRAAGLEFVRLDALLGVRPYRT